MATRSPIPPLESPNNSDVTIVPVTGWWLRRQFIRLPWSLYANDPVWIPPLLIERHEHISSRNPYFAHARAKFWLAYKGGKAVGRISAQIDDLHIERYCDSTGFFGMLEAVNDEAVFDSLLRTAETWLSSQEIHHIRGPFNLSINQECGLLVEGFQHPPMLMMGHAPPYYASRLEAIGYKGTKDTLAYRIDAEFTPPKIMTLVAQRTAERINVRALRREHFDSEIAILQDIFNDAWSGNWGYVPFTNAEFSHLAQSLKFLVADDLVQIAEVDGVPAAMIVVFPNVNEAIRDLNGRLFPFGWAKLLWRLKATHPQSARIPLMGVRKQYQRSLLGTALAFMVIDAVREPGLKLGIQDVELSWILEDNEGMRSILESLGGTAYKRYRIYQKTL